MTWSHHLGRNGVNSNSGSSFSLLVPLNKSALDTAITQKRNDELLEEHAKASRAVGSSDTGFKKSAGVCWVDWLRKNIPDKEICISTVYSKYKLSILYLESTVLQSLKLLEHHVSEDFRYWGNLVFRLEMFNWSLLCSYSKIWSQNILDKEYLVYSTFFLECFSYRKVLLFLYIWASVSVAHGSFSNSK